VVPFENECQMRDVVERPSPPRETVIGHRFFWARSSQRSRHRSSPSCVRVCGTLGVLAKNQRPATSPELVADRVVIRLPRLRRALDIGDRRMGFFGHDKLIVANHSGVNANDHHDIERIAIELMPAKFPIPIASASAPSDSRPSSRLFYGAVFRLIVAHLRFPGLAAGGSDRCVVDWDLIAVPAVTLFTSCVRHQPCRKAVVAAERDDRTAFMTALGLWRSEPSISRAGVLAFTATACMDCRSCR